MMGYHNSNTNNNGDPSCFGFLPKQVSITIPTFYQKLKQLGDQELLIAVDDQEEEFVAPALSEEKHEENEQQHQQLKRNLKEYGWSQVRVSMLVPITETSLVDSNDVDNRNKMNCTTTNYEDSSTTAASTTTRIATSTISALHLLQNYQNWKSILLQMFPHTKVEDNSQLSNNTDNDDKDNEQVSSNIGNGCNSTTTSLSRFLKFRGRGSESGSIQQQQHDSLSTNEETTTTTATKTMKTTTTNAKFVEEAKQSWEWKRQLSYHGMSQENYHHHYQQFQKQEQQQQQQSTVILEQPSTLLLNQNVSSHPVLLTADIVQDSMIGWTAIFHTIIEYISETILELPKNTFVVSSSQLSSTPTMTSQNNNNNKTTTTAGAVHMPSSNNDNEIDQMNDCIDLLRAFCYDAVPQHEQPTTTHSDHGNQHHDNSDSNDHDITPNNQKHIVSIDNNNNKTIYFGSNEHTDWGSFTIVWQDYDSNECLQTYCTRTRQWISIVPPLPPALPSPSPLVTSSLDTAATTTTTTIDGTGANTTTTCSSSTSSHAITEQTTIPTQTIPTTVVQIDLIVHVGDMTSLAIQHAITCYDDTWNHSTNNVNKDGKNIDTTSDIHSKSNMSSSNRINRPNWWPSPLHRVVSPSSPSSSPPPPSSSAKQNHHHHHHHKQEQLQPHPKQRCSLVYFCYPPPQQTMYSMIQSLIQEDWIVRYCKYDDLLLTPLSTGSTWNCSNSNNNHNNKVDATDSSIPYEKYYLLLNQSSSSSPTYSSMPRTTSTTSTASTTASCNDNRNRCREHFYTNVLHRPIRQVLDDKWNQVQR